MLHQERPIWNPLLSNWVSVSVSRTCRTAGQGWGGAAGQHAEGFPSQGYSGSEATGPALTAGSCNPSHEINGINPLTSSFLCTPRTGPKRRLPSDILKCPSLSNGGNRSHSNNVPSSAAGGSITPKLSDVTVRAPCSKGGGSQGPGRSAQRKRPWVTPCFLGNVLCAITAP